MDSYVFQKYRELARRYHSNSRDFEFSVGYMMQSTRNGLQYVEKAETMVVYTYRSGINEPVIVGAVGKNREDLILETATQLYQEHHCLPIVKNVDIKMEKILLESGFRHYHVDEWWDPYFKYDDNTFPEQILDVQQLRDLIGNKYKNLKSEVERFQRRHPYEINQAVGLDFSQVTKLAKTWAKNLNERNFVGEVFLIESVEMFFQPSPYIIHFTITHKKNQKLIGLLAFSEISNDCLAANLLLNDFSYRNSSRVFMVEGARCAGKLGYKFLNTQGSEDTNQHLAKRLLYPVDQIFKTHLVFKG